MNDKIRKNIESLLSTLSESKIKNLKNFLEDGSLCVQSDTYQITSKLGLSSLEINLVKKVLNDFQESQSVVLCLDLVSEIQQNKKQYQKNTSLSWTSPFVFNDKADNTRSMILELINSAKKSVTFVGYVIKDDTPDIFDALVSATKRGVQIRLLFDKAEKYLKLIQKMWEDRIPFPTIYSYKPKEKYSSLHAKVLIIDSREILITSANLTGRGVTRNVEMGIRHLGNPANDAEDLVNHLIENDYLVKIK